MRTLREPKLLVPSKDVDPTLWSVVACDQFTSEPEYWAKLEALVGDAPSTLRLIYPEAYIGKIDFEQKLDEIAKNMRSYYHNGIVEPLNSFVLCERKMSNGKIRRGLIAELDLEDYDPFGTLSVRATEKTVKERLPLRMRIRRGAIMELPHILVLLDDPQQSVIEKLYENKGDLLYSFPLNMEGGYLKGYKLDKSLTQKVFDDFEKNRSGRSSFYLAVGDGNHSLAAARENWLEIKKSLSTEEIQTHPARFALVEVVNLFEDSLSFEPIHRVVFDAKEDFLKDFPNDKVGTEIVIFDKGQKKSVYLKGTGPEMIARIQEYLDEYLKKHDGTTQDYVHGYDNLLKVSKNALGLVMPSVDKDSMFSYIQNNGVLTRKSFSMGEAADKRYYYESRLIVPDREA